MTVHLPLGRGYVALVDDADAERCRQYTWSLRISGGGRCHYAISKIAGRWVYLHRFIAAPGPGHVVDHRDGDGLDCRRSNLRVCSRAENNQTRGQNRKGGVIKTGPAWEAVVRVGDSKVSLGLFGSEEAARQAREDAIELAVAVLEAPDGWAAATREAA